MINLFSQNYECDRCQTLNPPTIHEQTGNGRLTACCASYTRGEGCYKGHDKDGRPQYTYGKRTKVYWQFPIRWRGFFTYRKRK